MDIDPHSIQQLLEKVRSQLRCPQCAKRIAVELSTLKVVGDSFAVFQLKCLTCEAFVLLHVTIAGSRPPKDGVRAEEPPLERSSRGHQRNVSTTLEVDPEELRILRQSLRESGGSFSSLFQSP